MLMVYAWENDLKYKFLTLLQETPAMLRDANSPFYYKQFMDQYGHQSWAWGGPGRSYPPPPGTLELDPPPPTELDTGVRSNDQN